ncbi:MAG TPA: selenide, water dikinase SelD [Candidatus Dormibacteraeota bacterium]|nr:selenide, water dikinase SelD [Candidatus Dormibacteraeota bacterium]
MTDPVRLTTLSAAGGCSAKIGQADLSAVLGGLLGPTSPDLLVGAGSGDDAAVYRLAPDLALVATCDFFPPPVDDPEDYGAIATANALSDVYAMGGEPLLLLNLVGFDLAALGAELLHRILRGGAEVAAAAGCVVAGGHSIRTTEPLFGCAAIGRVHPDRVVTNAGARPGDRLHLTKPLGTGVVLNAHKLQAAPAPVLAAAVATMRRLNRDAGRAMVAVGVHAATDVTGFGLLGHAHRLAVESGVRLRLRASALPLLPGARELVAAGFLPGGSRRNQELAAGFTDGVPSVPGDLWALACDAQTSGGLLVSLPPEAGAAWQAALPGTVEIGEVEAARGPAGEAGRVALEP